jgi:ankyrin repeat protein
MMTINDKERVVKAILNNDITELNQLFTIKDFNINAPLISNEKFIMHACMKSIKIEILKWFIDNQADINCQNDSGVSPLIVATIHKNLDAIKLLVSYKANLECQYILTKANPTQTKTALELAIDQDEMDIVNYLLLNGAKTDYLKLSNTKKDKKIKESIKALKEKNLLEETINTQNISKKNKI